MRAAIIADVHIGNHSVHGGESTGRINERCARILSALEAAVELAMDADVLIVAGDLFDNDRPFPDQLQSAGRILGRHPRVVIIVGNHDQHSTSPGDHAVAPLALVPSVTIAEDTDSLGIGDELAGLLPFFADPLTFDPAPGTKLVVAHHGIADEKTPPYLRFGKGSVQTKDLFTWMQMHGVKVYVAGDWHEHKKWSKGDMHIVQCGALVPTGWNNPGQYGYGSVIFVDTETWTWERQVVNGPRFVFAAAEEDVRKEVRRAVGRGDTPFVRTTCAEFTDESLAGAVIDWSPAIEKAEGAVQVAAEHLKSAETLDEALSLYVDNDAGIPDALKDLVKDKIAELMRQS